MGMFVGFWNRTEIAELSVAVIWYAPGNSRRFRAGLECRSFAKKTPFNPIEIILFLFPEVNLASRKTLLWSFSFNLCLLCFFLSFLSVFQIALRVQLHISGFSLTSHSKFLHQISNTIYHIKLRIESRSSDCPSFKLCIKRSWTHIGVFFLITTKQRQALCTLEHGTWQPPSLPSRNTRLSYYFSKSFEVGFLIPGNRYVNN